MPTVSVYGTQDLLLGSPPAEIDVTNTRRAPFVMRQVPWGEYFSRDAGWWPPVARGIARSLSRLFRRKVTFERNMNPLQAEELLDEWERMLEIEPDSAATLVDRQQAAVAKLRAVGGNTAEYYESIAHDFGYLDAVVTDAADPFTTVSLADDFLAGGEWKLTFTVTAASQGATKDAQLQELINGQLLAGWFAFFDLS